MSTCAGIVNEDDWTHEIHFYARLKMQQLFSIFQRMLGDYLGCESVGRHDKTSWHLVISVS